MRPQGALLLRQRPPPEGSRPRVGQGLRDSIVIWTRGQQGGRGAPAGTPPAYSLGSFPPVSHPNARAHVRPMPCPRRAHDDPTKSCSMAAHQMVAKNSPNCHERIVRAVFCKHCSRQCVRHGFCMSSSCARRWPLSMPGGWSQVGYSLQRLLPHARGRALSCQDIELRP